VTATRNRFPPIASVTARHRTFLRDLRRDRSRASQRRRPRTRARSPPSMRSSCEPAFSIARDGPLEGPFGTRSGSAPCLWRRADRRVVCPGSKPGDPGMQAYKFETRAEGLATVCRSGPRPRPRRPRDRRDQDGARPHLALDASRGTEAMRGRSVSRADLAPARARGQLVGVDRRAKGHDSVWDVATRAHS
jgi:hypothetical protein